MIAAHPRLRARLLGPFRVEIGERVVDRWERPTARRLVQYLLLANAHTASREQLMEALSPGLDRERAANAIAKSISMARSALGEHVVEASRSFVRLAVPVETDLVIAMAALERATAVAPGRRAALEDALALEGELLPEEPWAEWADAARVRLADLRRAATIELATAADDEERAAAWVGLAATPYRRGDMAGVIDICRLALDSIGGGASPGRGRLLAELGWAEVRAGRPKHGRPHLEQAAEIMRANSGKDPELPARVLDRLAMARSDCGDHAAGLEMMEEAFARAPRSYRRLGAILRLHRGSLPGRGGRPEEGLGDVFAARRVLTALGDVYSISVSHWEAAELLDQLGLLGRALAEREAEVRLLEPIDNPRNL